MICKNLKIQGAVKVGYTVQRIFYLANMNQISQDLKKVYSGSWETISLLTKIQNILNGSN